MSNANDNGVQRFGWVIMIKPDMIETYKKLHADPWPGVVAMIKDCNIRNYSIYLGELAPGAFYLFSYLEYTGGDFDADMQKMADDPETQRWWDVVKPCQKPIEIGNDSGWWADMEEVFHCD